MGNGFEKSFLKYHIMDYTKFDTADEFLPQPWFLKSNINSRVLPVPETLNPESTILFKEYYY